MNKDHELMWYLEEINDYIYDEDVIKLISPKLKEAKALLKGIEDLIKTFKDEGELNGINQVQEYLGYDELLAEIFEGLDLYFSSHI